MEKKMEGTVVYVPLKSSFPFDSPLLGDNISEPITLNLKL